MPHPNSLENLKLGGKSKKKGRKQMLIFIMPETIATLKKSGHASRFIEKLVQAYEQKRLLDPAELLESDP